jgi:hypothetical protein
MFLWRSLDPRITAQVILMLAARLSRGTDKPSVTEKRRVSAAVSGPHLRSNEVVEPSATRITSRSRRKIASPLTERRWRWLTAGGSAGEESSGQRRGR